MRRPLDRIPLSGDCSVTLHRTLRVPDDGGDHPLPPSLGSMAAYRVREREYVVPIAGPRRCG